MSHLHYSETYTCLDSLFSTLYGDDIYGQWQDIKTRLRFDSERQFVQWMLDYVSDNYVNKQEVKVEQKFIPKQNQVLPSRPNYWTNKRNHSKTMTSNKTVSPAKVSFPPEMQAHEEQVAESDYNDLLISGEEHELNTSVGELQDGVTVLGELQDGETVLGEVQDGETVLGESDCAMLDEQIVETSSESASGDRNLQLLVVSGAQYPCDICGKLYSCRGNMLQHQKEMHFNLTRFFCDYCSKTFSRSRHLSRHLKKSHFHESLSTLKSRCGTCHQLFESNRELDAHVKSTHPQVSCND